MGKRKLKKVKVTQKDKNEYIKSKVKISNTLIIIMMVPMITFIFSLNSPIFSLLIILSLLITLFKSSIWKTVLGTIIISLIIIMVSKYIWILSDTYLVFENFLVILILYLLWISLILRLAFEINSNSYVKDEIVNSLPRILERLHSPHTSGVKVISFLRKSYLIVMYLFTSIFTIGIYGNIYRFQQDFEASIDPYYFSAVTFFTVGFGEITPSTENMKFIVISEMFMSSALNIVFFPLILSVYYVYLSNKFSSKK
ncbi:ion channel [Paenibacillus xylanexedens]|uniref:ion channel n=1 Tax=Paenibacillus xylanexedens TaxID=528191 RepID=UPI000F53B42C|nr:ion channel [Paenibacillus xylanexedens]RPK29523.1 hypothetical protein EDO6_00146 [Paenibacillus xylanexedens]